MEIVLVPTTHWDREWYRTFQAFRARLVDTVDRVLELLDTDDGYRFLLDGQSIVLEDYLEIRPHRRADLERAVRSGRVEIGPWYVQPDSLMPSGEAHVRNLLEGRRVAEEIGPCSIVAYTPDSFGHPAQFPQLFAGFGLEHFVYWRGNDIEIAELPAEYAWIAPDGSAVLACHLWQTYSNAAGLSIDVDKAVARLKSVVDDLASRTRSDRIVLLAGTDHQPPEARTKEICESLAAATGHAVRRGTLRDFADGLTRQGRPTFTGELVGGRIANLLPGVWSTRTYLKIRNRRCETLLDGWAEPWAALGSVLGTPDERPSLRSAWRQLLQNQAHDSICGCSQDAVHEQMLGRYDYAEELARETTMRCCERIAGLGAERRTPWSEELDIAVFNPSPHPRTDVVRFPLQGYPPNDQGQHRFIHPLVWANMRGGAFTVDGAPARMVPVFTNDRVRYLADQNDWDVEFVAADVPAFGWKRVRLAPAEAENSETVDDGREIAADGVAVRANDDGTLDVSFGPRTFSGLGALENVGDRGDTYDFDPVSGHALAGDVDVVRHRDASGIQELVIKRYLAVPVLDEERSARTEFNKYLEVVTSVRVAPGVERVDLHVVIDNEARDHRLRMRFPTGRATDAFAAATTFDVATRATAARDASSWLHPAPTTFPSQGWISANDLCVVAPGLYEGEVTPDGTIAVTLLRAVGWLSRMDLKTRPQHAGPGLPTPGAQCIRRTEARISLLPGADPAAARDTELGFVATAAGGEPLHTDGVPLLELEPRELVLTALKPAEHTRGVVVRVLNPTDAQVDAIVRTAFDVRDAIPVRLDESQASFDLARAGRELRFPVPPHSLRSVLVT